MIMAILFHLFKKQLKKTQGSLLEDLYKIADAKGIERKGYYTIPEVKKAFETKRL